MRCIYLCVIQQNNEVSVISENSIVIIVWIFKRIQPMRKTTSICLIIEFEYAHNFPGRSGDVIKIYNIWTFLHTFV